MEVYKILVLIFGFWILLCSFMNKFHFPNFFCLDRIVGPFLFGIIKIFVFVALYISWGLKYGNDILMKKKD